MKPEHMPYGIRRMGTRADIEWRARFIGGLVGFGLGAGMACFVVAMILGWLRLTE